jgi:hypothetical protein
VAHNKTGESEGGMSSESGIWRLAYGLLAGLMIVAVVAAFALQGSGILSLTPPATWDNLNPVPDVVEGQALSLYVSAFTAWAALILLIPVFALVWNARRAPLDYARWLSFWTVSYIAYLIHLAVSMFWFFGGDFAAMTTSSRVSAFWPGMALVVLWAVDIVLARRFTDGFPMTVYRIFVHVLVFALFFGGSTIMGELTTVRMIGFALLAAGVTGLTVWLRDRTRKVA